MDRDVLKRALIKEGYQITESLEATVDRLLALNAKPFKMLEAWLYKNIAPKFEPIEGVDSDFLKNKLQMKAPAIILAYSMLLDSAKENADYFRYLSENKIGFYPSKVKHL